MMRPYGDDQPIDRRFMHHRHPWPKARRAEERMRRAQRKTARRGGLLEARRQLGDPSFVRISWDVDLEYWDADL
jgi:hypothetical protein